MQPLNLPLPSTSYPPTQAKQPLSSSAADTTQPGLSGGNGATVSADTSSAFNSMESMLPLLQMMLTILQMFMGSGTSAKAAPKDSPSQPSAASAGSAGNGGSPASTTPAAVPASTGGVTAPVTGGVPSSPLLSSPPVASAITPSVAGNTQAGIPGSLLPSGGTGATSAATTTPGSMAPFFGYLMAPAAADTPGSAPTPAVGSAIPSTPTQTARSEQLRDVNFANVGKDANGVLVDSAAREQFSNGNTNRNSTAIIHLGGRSHTSATTSANGVPATAQMYASVLATPNSFTPEEVAYVQKARDSEMATRGVITGETLDHDFITEMTGRSNISPDKAAQYHAAIDQKAAALQTSFQDPQKQQAILDETNKGIQITSDIDTIQQRTGLTQAEQAIYRLAGHSVLFNADGKVSSEILGISYKNQNALDSQAGTGQRINIDGNIEALAGADVADDGVANGTSLQAGTQSVLDKVFLGSGGVADNSAILAASQQRGLGNGRSMQQIGQAVSAGGMQALTDLKTAAKDHSPAMLAAGTSMAAASAICPFLGGAAAATAGGAATPGGGGAPTPNKPA
jgi:hypothetical protein